MREFHFNFIQLHVERISTTLNAIVHKLFKLFIIHTRLGYLCEFFIIYTRIINTAVK